MASNKAWWGNHEVRCCMSTEGGELQRLCLPGTSGRSRSAAREPTPAGNSREKKMASKPCRECKAEVSAEAKTCPHCGLANPTKVLPSAKDAAIGGIAVAVAVAIGATMFGCRDADKAAATAKRMGDDAACSRDLQCLGDKGSPSGISGASGPPDAQVARLDESGLISAVGSPVICKYQLDDGHGLNFRASNLGPDFNLEFRRGRMNVSWASHHEPPEFGAMNEQNRQWVQNVLTHAFGKTGAHQIIERIRNGDARPIDVLGRKVHVMPGKDRNLVTIYR